MTNTNLKRFDLKNLIKEMVTKLSNPSIKINNRAADTVQSLLSQADVVKIIKYSALLFTAIKKICNL